QSLVGPPQQKPDGLLVGEEPARKFQLGERGFVLLPLEGNASQLIMRIGIISAQGSGAPQQANSLLAPSIALVEYPELISRLGVGRVDPDGALQQPDGCGVVVVE